MNVKINELLDVYTTDHADFIGMKGIETTVHNTKPLRECFGDMVFQDIKPIHVMKYLKDRRELGRSDNTIRREFCVFHAAVSKGIEYEVIDQLDRGGDFSDDYHIAHRLMETISKFRPKAVKRKKTPTHEQFENIIERLPMHMKHLAQAASLTCYRKSELLSLRWSDIDFNRKIISLSDTKNGEDRETPMYRDLLKFFLNLKRYTEKWGGSQVFKDQFGRPLVKPNTYRTWRTAVKKAGYIVNGKHEFNFHDLRRYGCRLLQERYGFPPTMIIDHYSGHKSEDIFQEIYNGRTVDSRNHYYDIAMKT